MHGHRSVVLESSAKPSQKCLPIGTLGLVWQKIQESLTQVAILLGVERVKQNIPGSILV